MKRLAMILGIWLAAGSVGAVDLMKVKPLRPYLPELAAQGYYLYATSHGFQPQDLDNYSIGQSHIDAAWLWRKAQTHDKVYKTWGEAVEKMDRHPGFIFAGSSSQYYEWMMADHPEVFAKIVDKEKAGGWEIVGGMWVEPDCNVPEGESFARQFLLGQRFYLEHFGHTANICWVPDSFGYNRNFPQLISRAGGKYLWSAKMNWNKETHFPFRNFWWRGPDGSTILTSINAAGGFYPIAELGGYKDTRYLVKPGEKFVADYLTSPAEVSAAMSKDWMNAVGIFYGAGDGGSGPTDLEIQIQEALIKKGWSKFSRALPFFQTVEKNGDRLPTWNDELYFEYHQGVQTTHAEIKRANRLSEQLLHTAETLRGFLSLYGVEYPAETIKEIWKLVLLNQFHDIIPGSSIPEVYEDAMADHAQVQAAAIKVTQDGLAALAGRVAVKPPDARFQGLLVFNPLPWSRGGLVKIKLETGSTYQVKDQSGKFLYTQAMGRGEEQYLLFRADNVPSAGYRVYYLRKVSLAAAEDLAGGLKNDPAKLSVSEDSSQVVLENEQARVKVDKARGLIVSLVDKASGQEMIQGTGNQLLAFYDRPLEYRAWNIDPNYQKHPIELPASAEVKVTASGPFYVEALARRELTKDGQVTKFDQRVRLFAGDPIVYIDLDSDYRLENSLLKLEFNTTINSDQIAADGPYVVVERSTHPRTPWDQARWEMICHKWLDLSDGKLGLALLNNGKYGFSLNPTGTGFRLTLIKGAEYPMANSDAVNVVHYNALNLPYTDQGMHHLELGLLVHPGGWREAKLWEAGYNFNAPLVSRFTEAHDGAQPAEGSFISLSSDTGSVYIGAVKRAEDDNDLVVRLVEAAGKNSSATLTLGQGLKIEAAAETDLVELNPQPLAASGSSLRLELGPYQIRTVKIKAVK